MKFTARNTGSQWEDSAQLDWSALAAFYKKGEGGRDTSLIQQYTNSIKGGFDCQLR